MQVSAFCAWPRRSPSGSRTRIGLNARDCWVREPAPEYVRPVQRIAVRCRRQDGTFAYGVLISSLSAEQVFTLLGRSPVQATDPVAILAAYVNFYDLRGGGLETSLKGDQQGMGLTKRNKKRFEAQHMLVLLGSLAHNVVVWARRWLAVPQLRQYGPLRMVRDVCAYQWLSLV